MSDLLTRMIARSAGTTGGIMPVVPSRYEVSPASPAVPDAWDEQIVEAPVHATPRTEGRLIARPRIPAVPHEDDCSVEPATAPLAASAGIAANRPVARPLQVRAQSAPRPADELQSPRAAEDDIIEGAGEMEGIGDAEFTPEEWPHFETEAGIMNEPFSRAAPAASEPVRGAPRRRTPFESRSDVPERSVEVHVSIGHIELRQAAPASPPVQRRPTAPPPVPLEELLKRTRRGSR